MKSSVKLSITANAMLAVRAFIRRVACSYELS